MVIQGGCPIEVFKLFFDCVLLAVVGGWRQILDENPNGEESHAVANQNTRGKLIFLYASRAQKTNNIILMEKRML